MRKIDWEAPLSEDDLAWLRQAGFMSEEQIAIHQSQFGEEVAEPEVPADEVTKSALDPTARMGEPVPPGNGAAVLVDPTKADPQDIEDDDDYDTWKVSDLEDEVAARDGLPDSGDVEIVGTGQNGKVLKADLIKGLRLWDTENPGALKD
jgi:hypothetical protein